MIMDRKHMGCSRSSASDFFFPFSQSIKSPWSRVVEGFLQEGYQEGLSHSGSVSPEMCDCYMTSQILFIVYLTVRGQKSSLLFLTLQCVEI